MNLKNYQSKRNFEKTSEPKGKIKPSGEKLKYVIQYHEARAKHFDFRLEHEGVLLSWAVPKGPSLNPKDKRIAVRVENHPLDYASFEGVIPKGEYGGGTVIIWDEGCWKCEGNVNEGLKNGSLKFSLDGERLKGKWTLVRLKKEGEKENWLLIKEKDGFVKATFTLPKTSVKTGRTNAQLLQKKTKPLPFKSILPMLAKLQTEIPKGKDYLFEVKYDGYRILAYIENGKAKLFTRNNLDYSQKFEEVTEQMKTFFANHSLVLDGEMIVADSQGRSDFGLLQSYIKNPDDKNLTYMVFDLLALDGKDLRKTPILERKKILKKLLKNSPPQIQFSEHLIGQGEQSFAVASKLGLEGIVGKKVNSTYSSSRSGDWIKIKCYHRQEFVLGGYQPSEKKSGGIGAILVGYYKNGELKYVGKVGTGIDEGEAKTLLKKFAKLKTKTSPFSNLKSDKNTVFLKPALVAEVQFAEITADGLLRQGSFKGLREDKASKDVVMEEADKSEVDGVEITSPERIIYKKERITKLDVAKYYSAVSERMLDYVKDRIVSVVRCHDDVEGEKFFKKHPLPNSKNIKIIKILGENNEKSDYFCLKNKKSLISEVQLGTIEFHTWGSKVGYLNKPDMMVFDLDPDSNLELEKVRQGARDLKRVLSVLGLKCFLKTSGGKGYHIVVPLVPSVGWQKFHDFAKNVAEYMEGKWPERYTTNIRKDNRKGKIFIDWVRNGKGATSVAPYSLRAREGGTVSMPIRWSELDSIAPNGIDMKEALRRLKYADPWKGFFNVKQKLKKN